MGEFTPVPALVGGAFIGLALSLILIATGRIAGLSGIVAGLLGHEDRAWRAWFVAGMVGAGACFQLVDPSTFDAAARVPLPLVAVSGVLVGVGTRLSNGCTSGHAVCGMSRFSRRSITATFMFCGTASVAATITGGLL